jgi:hypothetical protein
MSIYKSSSLAMIPTAYKDGKLYSIRPTDGDGDFTFSRGSNLAATRVDVNGLIEKGRENLLLQSNQFDTTWTLTSSISLTSGQSGYDGSNDAWLLKRSDTSARRTQQVITPSGVQTYSVYAKAESVDWLFLFAFDGSSSYDAYFDLASGVVGTKTNLIDAKIESVGNGWYRCSITYTAAITFVRIYPAVADGNITGGISPAGIYIQDAQLEQGLVATDYIETTTTSVSAGILEDMPRLDYSGSCPSLLLEPSRTNLITQSEYIGSWGTLNASVTDNATTSPEGVSNAAALVDDATNASHYVQSSVITHATGQDMMASVFLKKGTRTQARLRLSGGTGSAYFNLEDGSVVSESGATATIEDYGNGWYRCAIFDDSAQFGTGRLQVMSAVNGNSSYIGDSTEAIYIYGAQYEHNVSYPTSYIPTYVTSQTRSLDNVNELTGVSDLIGQSEGTLFLDFVANDDDALQIIYQVRTTGSTNVGQIDFRIQSGLLRALGNDAGTTQFNISAGAAVAGTRYKCAVRYANNDVAFYVNGVLKGSDTNASFSSSALQQISFSENTGTFFPSASIKQALVFPTGLTNTELASLTTL